MKNVIALLMLSLSGPLLADTKLSDEVSTQAGVWLQQAESYRGPSHGYVLNGRIETLKDAVTTKIQHYQLLSGEDRRSLVIFTAGVNQGQKVLQQDQQFWLQIPGSRRPLRITPMQKIMGEASSGDVASLSWREDYQVQAAREHTDEILLTLQAAREGLSYQRIELWIGKTDQFPLRASFYLSSGKQAKNATFVRGQLGGAARVVAMQLQDTLQSKNLTVLHYDELRKQTLPPRYFNPQGMSSITTL